ncbi:methyltransferase domain-containing protein [Streptomyces sp. DSM 42041]|uniref:Methyltransferase domain-containing protein n=1 Tax=Streptomyces hazeniae TaxID=3075538 RepID=A0ABU2NP42_9ACTN|nr:methyltransferase domain-containing protein [Streptomyces sp. DSM 42041]MDT0378744.1 methyltransferase domain-containing protein [Streptomyces sp. DSM 42041]
MTPTLVHHPQRARDWAEIQERMLVPLYEAVFDRLEVGSASHVLDLGCGSGLALLLAAARGASVTGVEPDETRLALARERLMPEPGGDPGGRRVRLVGARVEDEVPLHEPLPTVVTAFEALPGPEVLSRTVTSLERNTPVVLAGWGPAERCGAASVLRVAERTADTADRQDGEAGEAPRMPGCWQPGGRDGLEELARTAGLRLDGSGRVSCPFGYADMDSAVRGLLSTGLYDRAERTAEEGVVRAELIEALAPHRRGDGTVWMPNLFRYVIARV